MNNRGAIDPNSLDKHDVLRICSENEVLRAKLEKQEAMIATMSKQLKKYESLLEGQLKNDRPMKGQASMPMQSGFSLKPSRHQNRLNDFDVPKPVSGKILATEEAEEMGNSFAGPMT